MPQIDIKHLDISKRNFDILKNLLETYVPNSEVWAYGSRVTGQAHEGSDLDLVLRGDNNLSAYNDLIEGLQNSMISILVDVHQWNNLPESFYPNIEEAYIILQRGKTPEKHK
jgi:predicted nucleotidyltransferase